jgi:hypothetical protein
MCTTNEYTLGYIFYNSPFKTYGVQLSPVTRVLNQRRADEMRPADVIRTSHVYFCNTASLRVPEK